MGRVREIHRLRRRVRVGAPDPSLTPVSGMAAVDRVGRPAGNDQAVGRGGRADQDPRSGVHLW